MIHLALCVFNEKTVAALKIRGHNDTAEFIHLVVRLWKIMNIGSRGEDTRLNDPDRAAFTSSDDHRFGFMKKIATMFEKMDTTLTKYDKRVMCLTSQTSNAASVTLNGMIELIMFLLSNGMRYVCTRDFNSDR